LTDSQSKEKAVSLCEIKGVNKSFFGSKVLNDINLGFDSRSIVGLAGENGAGKSTLMKIISGAYVPDSGEVAIEGVPIHYGNPLLVQRMGVSVIYQEFSLIPQLSVAENLHMRNFSEKNRLARVQWKQMNQDSEYLLSDLGADNINPKTLVQDLSVANKQIVEIAKSLTANPKLLLMDEPSATLNAKETQDMFRIVKKLCADGVGIVYITHRLEEMFEICDRLVVMKDGEIANQCGFDNLDKDDIIRMMVGRDISVFFDAKDFNAKKEDVLLSVDNLSSAAGVQGISLKLHKGETLGIAGLNGSGRSELVRAICGMDRAKARKVEVDGKPARIKNVRDAKAQGIAYLPEERKSQGMIATMSVRENMSYASIRDFCKHSVINKGKEKNAVKTLAKKLNVKCQSEEQLIKNLSGGNQQKVIVGKWMLSHPKIYLMDEPTRGIDVGAKHEIYELINQLTSEGAGVIFISSELPELLGVSDRILVMANGTITAELSRDQASEEEIMRHAFISKAKEGARDDG
jgi:ribose transport system ATP-binding protein